jgi:molecular chaperone DnaJ
MDFYTLLGITRAASSIEVERAYRRLQRRYHPGVNPGDRVAENLYRQIQEAFDVLGDVERRRQYDNGTSDAAPSGQPAAVAFEGFDFSAPAEGNLAATFSELFADVFHNAAREATTPTKGGDISLLVDVPFVDAMRGCQVPVSLTRLERCPTCAGAGALRRSMALCAGCRGEGARRWARGHMVFTKPCELCEGTGQTAAEPCRPCRGAGVMPRTEVVTVDVPAGIDSGARIVVPGRGHRGALNGPAGDLYVTVHVGQHPHFRRVGSDLHLTVPISVTEAAFGGTIEVPSLEGPLEVVLPVGGSSGSQVVIDGKGVTGPAGRGSLVLTLQISLPASLDERSRALLDEFGRLNRADVRRQLFT